MDYSDPLTQGLEGGDLIPHSHSFFTRIPHPAFFIAIPNPVFSFPKIHLKRLISEKVNKFKM